MTHLKNALAVGLLAVALDVAQAGPIVLEELCGEWDPQAGNVCGASQLCTGSTSSFNAAESFEFASDGSYTKLYLISTGGCPIDKTSGNMVMFIKTYGHYTIGGEASEGGTGFTKFTYKPQDYTVALIKNNKAVYYAPLEPGASAGPCVLPVDMMQSSVGCPCNGTWVSGAAYLPTGNWTNARRFSKAGQVNAMDAKGEICPAGSCPNEFFFDSRTLYGNVKYTNSTTDGRTLQLTEFSADSATGWSFGDKNIKYKFKAKDTSCKHSVDPDATMSPTSSPTKTPGSGTMSGAVRQAGTTAASIICASLLFLATRLA